MDFTTHRQSILIYQVAGILGLLVASAGRLDPTVLTPHGQRLPHWAVTNRAQISAIYAPDSWSKIAGVVIAAAGFAKAYHTSKIAEKQELEELRQLNHQSRLCAIRQQEELQRQIMSSAEMLRAAQSIEELRADNRSDEEIANLLGISVEEFRAFTASQQQTQEALPARTVSRENDTSESRIPNPPDDPTVYGLLLATLRALHKAGHYVDYATSFKALAFVNLILEVRDSTKLDTIIDKSPTIIQASLHLKTPPIVSNADGYLSVAIARPDREYRQLANELDDIPTPKTPALLLGLNLYQVNEYIRLDGRNMESILIGGFPRSGKTTLLKQMIGFAAYNYSYRHIQFILFDGKQTEFISYKNSPYLVEWPSIANRQVGRTESDAELQLAWVEQDIENRRSIIGYQDVTNIEEYNALEGVVKLPYRIWIVDEFQYAFPDLQRTAKTDDGELNITSRLANVMSIAATFGWLIILATQAPDRKLINRQIDAKIGHRIALRLNRDTDSELVIQYPGAEKLLDNGDLLSRRGGDTPVRLQAYGTSNDDLKKWLFPKVAKLNDEQKRDLIFQLRSKGKSNAYIISKVWNVAEGDQGWPEAQQEFLQLTVQDHPENLPP